MRSAAGALSWPCITMAGSAVHAIYTLSGRCVPCMRREEGGRVSPYLGARPPGKWAQTMDIGRTCDEKCASGAVQRHRGSSRFWRDRGSRRSARYAKRCARRSNLCPLCEATNLQRLRAQPLVLSLVYLQRRYQS
ncbi:hypothetical protein PENSPDRAFT_466017 [Peniophora sp. CONT]|nr:hypothetical protein PENSPDRAFT_466017 [Peniophora sp. CONT]